MTSHVNTRQPPRTVLEQKIKERHQTYEEFAEYAEKFARDHNEPGTLSVRHLQRLAAGHRGDHRPLGPVRPATVRLLEQILGLPIADLLAAPTTTTADNPETELRQRINASRRVDSGCLDLFAAQLDAIRQLDRQLGAPIAYRDATTKTAQIQQLLAHSLSPATRTRLATLLSDASALAGWAALDLGKTRHSWEHHEHAKTAAREADSTSLTAYTTAQQAVILIDLGELDAATEQLAAARSLIPTTGPAVLRAWLAAAHGEGLAATGHRTDALHAFDTAHALLPNDPVEPTLPFVFLSEAHLTRWHGHALTTLRDRQAVTVLAGALRAIDRTFTRAETGLHTDLAMVLNQLGEEDAARQHRLRAWRLASEIGSVRQQAKLRNLSPQGVP